MSQFNLRSPHRLKHWHVNLMLLTPSAVQRLERASSKWLGSLFEGLPGSSPQKRDNVPGSNASGCSNSNIRIAVSCESFLLQPIALWFFSHTYFVGFERGLFFQLYILLLMVPSYCIVPGICTIWNMNWYFAGTGMEISFSGMNPGR